jgi:hypothetical protein
MVQIIKQVVLFELLSVFFPFSQPPLEPLDETLTSIPSKTDTNSGQYYTNAHRKYSNLGESSQFQDWSTKKYFEGRVSIHRGGA